MEVSASGGLRGARTGVTEQPSTPPTSLSESAMLVGPGVSSGLQGSLTLPGSDTSGALPTRSQSRKRASLAVLGQQHRDGKPGQPSARASGTAEPEPSAPSSPSSPSARLVRCDTLPLNKVPTVGTRVSFRLRDGARQTGYVIGQVSDWDSKTCSQVLRPMLRTATVPVGQDGALAVDVAAVEYPDGSCWSRDRDSVEELLKWSAHGCTWLPADPEALDIVPQSLTKDDKVSETAKSGKSGKPEAGHAGRPLELDELRRLSPTRLLLRSGLFAKLPVQWFGVRPDGKNTALVEIWGNPSLYRQPMGQRYAGQTVETDAEAMGRLLDLKSGRYGTMMSIPFQALGELYRDPLQPEDGMVPPSLDQRNAVAQAYSRRARDLRGCSRYDWVLGNKRMLCWTPAHGITGPDGKERRYVEVFVPGQVDPKLELASRRLVRPLTIEPRDDMPPYMKQDPLDDGVIGVGAKGHCYLLEIPSEPYADWRGGPFLPE